MEHLEGRGRTVDVVEWRRWPAAHGTRGARGVPAPGAGPARLGRRRPHRRRRRPATGGGLPAPVSGTSRGLRSARRPTISLFVFFSLFFFLPPPSKSTVDDVSEPIATNGEILHHNRRFVESYSLPSPFLFLGSLPARLARRMDPSFFFLVEVSLARWRWRCPTRICLFLVEASPGRWRLRRHTKKSPRSFRFFFCFSSRLFVAGRCKKKSCTSSSGQREKKTQ